MAHLRHLLQNLFVEKTARWFALAICLVFFTIFTLISLHRFWQYEAWYYDFGIFARAIYQVSQFQAPVIDHFAVGGKVIFADHFHPIIFLLSPLFWLTDRAEVLLIVQTLAVSLSGYFIYRTAKHVTKNSIISLALLTIYFSFTGLHFALISEFHEITLLPLPLALFFYALVKKSIRWYILATVLVLMVKESTFIIPAFFTLMEVIRSKGNWRKINLILLAVSVIYGLLVIKLIIPYFAQGNYQYGGTELLSLQTLEQMVNTPLKRETLVKTLASYGFLPLLAPHTLAPVLVNWATRFSSLATTRHDLGMHYNAEIAPTLIFGTILGVRQLQLWFKKERLIQLGVIGLAVWAMFFSIIVLKSPIRLAFIPDFYRHTANFAFLNQLVAKVPNEGIVMAQANLAPRFIDQPVYMLRLEYEGYQPDWIVIDTRAGQNPNNFYGIGNALPEELFAKLAKDPNYQVYYAQGEQLIYQRVKTQE